MASVKLSNGLVEEAAAQAIKDGVSVENGLALSQAISLKRIADRLESVTCLPAEDMQPKGQLNVGADVRNHY